MLVFDGFPMEEVRDEAEAALVETHPACALRVLAPAG